MSAPQIITTAAGEELVVLPKADYDALRAAADESAEDAALNHAADAAEARLAAGESMLLPAEIATAIMDGANPIKTIRVWREMNQRELAAAAEIDPGYLSALEAKAGRRGSIDVLGRIAAALAVPLDAIHQPLPSGQTDTGARTATRIRNIAAAKNRAKAAAKRTGKRPLRRTTRTGAKRTA